MSMCRSTKTSAGFNPRVYESDPYYTNPTPILPQYDPPYTQAYDPRATWASMPTCAHCGALQTASFVGDAAKLTVGGIGGLAAVHGVGAVGGYMHTKVPGWGGETIRDAMIWKR